MKSKVYVLSQDSLLLQHLHSFCSQWDMEVIEIKQEPSLPIGLQKDMPVNSYTNTDIHYEDSKVISIADLEKQAIENAIKECRGNLTEVSRELKIGRATLYRKLKQYNIALSLIRKRRVA